MVSELPRGRWKKRVLCTHGFPEPPTLPSGMQPSAQEQIWQAPGPTQAEQLGQACWQLERPITSFMHKYEYIFFYIYVQNQKQARRSGQPFVSLVASDPVGLLSPVTAWAAGSLPPTSSSSHAPGPQAAPKPSPGSLPSSPALPRRPQPPQPGPAPALDCHRVSPRACSSSSAGLARSVTGPPPSSHVLTAIPWHPCPFPALLSPSPVADLPPPTASPVRSRQRPPQARPMSGRPARACRSPLSRARAGGFPRPIWPFEQKGSTLRRRWERRETAPQQQLAASPPPRRYTAAQQNIYVLHLVM